MPGRRRGGAVRSRAGTLFSLACVSVRLIAALIILVGPVQADAGRAKPKRIVSLNLCTDELILRLADHENIASVTWLSRDPNYSNVANLAASVPINRGLAEEVIPLNPDLVVAGVQTARTAVAMLKQARFPVLELEVPHRLEDVRSQIRRVAQAIGEPERAERMLADMDGRLSQFTTAATRQSLRALVFDSNGFTTGPGSLVDQIITTAGLENVAAGLGVRSYARIPLEIAATSGADIFIVNGHRDGPPSLATELLRHPILAKLPHRFAPIVLPSRLWTCGGPAILTAIGLLSGAAATPIAAGAPQ